MSVTSSEENPVDAVKDLLEGQPSSSWTNADPTIEYHWDVPYSEKGPADDQPAELYVWSPVDSTLEQLSASGDFLDEGHSVEVQIWSLSDPETADYMRDVIQIFGDYLDDNTDTTEFITLPPTSARDLRSDKIPQKTSHYIAQVEIEPRKLTSAGT